jgi:MFS transporter, putative metabolite:H+ symporter
MLNKNNYWIAVIAVALGYFVDLYDILLFSTVRKPSLLAIGVPENQLLEVGLQLQNWQLFGMLLGGILMGVLADKRGRLSILFASIFIYSVANILNAYVTDVTQYTILRFITGIGLAGELGVGITLVSENVPKDKRTIATMIISAFGLLGGAVAAMVASKMPWQTSYIVGGTMGLLLLAFRYSVKESALFENLKEKSVSKGNFLHLITQKESLKKFIFCIFSGAPGMFFTAFYVTLAPEFAKSFGLGNVTTAQVLLYYMLAYSAFDVVGNLISKLLNSRKLTILLFCGIQVFAILNLFILKPTTVDGFIIKYVILGASLGYIGVVVTNIAEQFGTNLRATATTSATNLLRALTIPGTWLFTFLNPTMGIEKAGMTVGLVFVLLSVFSILQLKDNFENNLDFNE